jgi:magnesium transporter
MAKVRAYAFRGGKISKVSLENSAKLRAKGATVWVDIEDPSKKELQFLEKGFGFHHLAVEDASNTKQRCKVEEYKGFVFIVLRVFPKGSCDATQLNFFLDGNILVTAHFKCVEAVDGVAAELLQNPALLGRGPDFLAYKIMDLCVDSLFPHLDEIEDHVDSFEDRLVKASAPEQVEGMLSKLFEMKRRNLAVRKVGWPMRDVLTVLARRDYKYVKEENAVYFRDVYDHMLRITDMTETNRELLSASMEAYLAVISNNLNMVMKKLAALACIFAIPMLVASIYGMNFANMPELKFELGYYIALAEMIVASFLMFLYFRMNKWI